MVEPHEGRLVNRLERREKAASLDAEARELPVIQLNPLEVSDLEMLAIGAFSPLEGFMGRAVLREGGHLPPEFTRPEVAAVLHKVFGQQQMGQGA